jgi:hypothetical protein
MVASRRSRLLAALLVLAGAVLVAGCSIISPSPPPSVCGQGCLDPTVLNFKVCAEGQSSNLSQEERQRFEASIQDGLVGGGGVVELSKKIVDTKSSDVALEIVRGCLELSKNIAKPGEVGGIDQQIQTLQDILDAHSEGTIVLDPDHGPYDQAINVTGAHWGSTVELEISAGPSKVRVTTKADGTFEKTFRLDPAFEAVSGTTQTIQVRPVKASTQFPASALYTIDT